MGPTLATVFSVYNELLGLFSDILFNECMQGFAIGLRLCRIVIIITTEDKKQGWLAVAKTITWTVSAILIWFMLIGPLFTKVIQKLLQKKQSRYSDEVLKTLSFLPVLRKLTTLAWQQSKLHHGYRRWYFFFASLIHTTLTYSEPSTT